MKVFGIDPGTAILGWAYIETDSSNDLIKSSLKYGAVTTLAGVDMADRLLTISNELSAILAENKPEVVGIEKLFFSKNVKTAITVAQARGVAIMESRRVGAKIFEMTPPEVKEAVVGYGKADKAQIQNMVKMILGLKEIPKPDDAADAIAVAMATAQMARFESRLRL
jgi:crossover junction endodeoxyribonuclease RuvC